MTWLSCLRIASWLLLMAAMLPSGWSRSTLDDEEICLPKCHCSIALGLRRAECRGAGMTKVPTGLSDQIPVLVLNDNNISKLESKIFSNVGLAHLREIYMRNCSIEEVDKQAFANLGVIIDIVLSENKIKRLDPVTFQQTIRLEYLAASDNLIERLENGLFSNLLHLEQVDFISNRLSEIGDRAFVNLPKLKILKLNDNKFVRLQASIFQLVGSHNSLSFYLQDNPWHCDCQLRQFFKFVKSNASLLEDLPFCREPEHMRNITWDTLKSEQFICLPGEGAVVINTKNINIIDGNKLDLESTTAQDRENITTISKPTTNRSRTLDKKLDIIINQNELLRQKMEQLEVKINDSKSFTRRNNKDAGIVINIE